MLLGLYSSLLSKNYANVRDVLDDSCTVEDRRKDIQFNYHQENRGGISTANPVTTARAPGLHTDQAQTPPPSLARIPILLGLRIPALAPWPRSPMVGQGIGTTRNPGRIFGRGGEDTRDAAGSAVALGTAAQTRTPVSRRKLNLIDLSGGSSDEEAPGNAY